METLSFFLNILKVILGLGFVIFLHELGHFLVAKWCGVYVKSFSVGFPPTIWSKKWGETDYKIGLLFLGGYVSMLGEGPEEDAEAGEDPRSFKNQSVGERIAILSAGVVMNLFLGLTFFLTTHMLGVEILPAQLGAVQAGSPAYEAGLRGGDKVVAIDGDPNIDFMELTIRVSLSGAGQAIRFDVKRPGVDEVIPILIQPKRQGTAETPKIGVSPSAGLEVAEKPPFQAPVGMDGKAPSNGEFLGGDTIVGVAAAGSEPMPIKDINDLNTAMFALCDKPIDVVVERKHPKGSQGDRATVTIPVHHLVRFGFRTELGPVKSIQGESIALKAGFLKGDQILKVDDRTDIDPFDLPLYCYEHAGQTVRFVVRRSSEVGEPREVEIAAVPDRSLPWTEMVLPAEPFEIPGLGLAVELPPKVTAVSPGSEAEKAGIKTGMTIRSVEFVDPKPEPGQKPDVLSLEKTPSWPFVFDQIQRLSPRDVRLEVEGIGSPVTIKPQPDPTVFHPFRGINLMTIIEDVPPQPFGVAFRRGLDDTYDNVIRIYAMIRSLFQGLVSPKNLAGLPRIAGMAYQSASAGIVPLLQFLGMLSINLAVLNFMPIPPLDGGQIALILAEKIRGRPVPQAFFNAIMITGLVLIVGLMLFTNGQDIFLLIRGK